MKAVMRELAQAKRHYSKLPLFEFLRTESIPPRDRLAFYPCMAPFILAFRVFDMFTDWTTELLAYAKNSLAHRTVPHVVHTNAARLSAQ